MKKLFHSTFLAAAALAAVLSNGAAMAHDDAVKVEGAWARPSVQGQKATGAFMRLTSKDGARLVRVESPAASITEVHEMKMDGDIMRMRAVPVLELPAGKTIELKPGGYHLMLQDLKAPLMKNTSVPLTLTLQNAKGVESQLTVSVPVSTVAPGDTSAPAIEHKH